MRAIRLVLRWVLPATKDGTAHVIYEYDEPYAKTMCGQIVCGRMRFCKPASVGYHACGKCLRAVNERTNMYSYGKG